MNQWWAFATIMITAALLRIPGLDQSFWLDEATQVLAASRRQFFDLVTQYSLGDFHPPLYHVILWVWFKLLPVVEWSARLPSFLFSLGTIAIIFAWGNQRRRHLGTLSSFLLALAPLHVYYSHEARMYMTAAFGITLAMWMLWISVQRAGWWVWALYFLGMVIGLGADYLPWFILPVQWIWAVLFIGERLWWKKFLIVQGVLFSTILIWIPILFRQLAIGLSIAEAVPAWEAVVGGFTWTALPLATVKFVIGRLPTPDDLFGRGIIALLLLPFGWMLISSLKRRSVDIVLLWAWVTIPVLLAISVSLFLPIFSYFRLLFLLPAIVVLLAHGILVQRHHQWIIVGLLATIFGSASVLYATQSQFWREDWRSATAYLDQEDALVLFVTPLPPDPYTYYSTKKRAAGLVAIHEASFRDQLAAIVEREENIVLSSYLQDISDPARRVQEELDRLGFVADKDVVFRGIGTITRYVRT